MRNAESIHSDGCSLGNILLPNRRHGRIRAIQINRTQQRTIFIAIRNTTVNILIAVRINS